MERCGNLHVEAEAGGDTQRSSLQNIGGKLAKKEKKKKNTASFFTPALGTPTNMRHRHAYAKSSDTLRSGKRGGNAYMTFATHLYSLWFQQS